MNVISSQTRTWMDAGIYVHDDSDASTYGDADAALDVRPGARTHVLASMIQCVVWMLMLLNMLAFGNMLKAVQFANDDAEVR